MSMLLSGITFLVFVFAGIYLLISLYNKNIKAIYDKYSIQTSNLTNVAFKNIKISHIVTNGLKYYPSINNTADIYLFDNFLIILRKQNFIFQLKFEPIIICKDSDTTKQFQGFNNVVMPDKIIIKTIVKGKIEIYLTDKKYDNCKTTITLKELNINQTNQLSRIGEWN